MNRPDFFLVGAPKSGTTAMDRYLAEHPAVGMCSRKEVHYFGSDIRRGSLSEPEYLALFPPGGDRIGESSVWYLYSERAAAEIEAFAPEADIVIMLRNPVDMMHALHSQFLWSGKEERESFADALAMDEAREEGREPRAFTPISYRSAATYSIQVERYLERFGEDRVHIILFDDFERDAAGEYRKLCRHLGISDRFTPSLRVVNENKRSRSRLVRRITRKPPVPLVRFVSALTPPRLRRRAWKSLVDLNRVSEPRQPLPLALRTRLEEEFADERRRLSRLIGRDLSIWTYQGSKARQTAAPS